MTDNDRYVRARKRVEEIKGFYLHVFIYVVVNIGLVFMDWASGEGWWFYWATMGWGIGVAAHAAALFMDGMSGWETRKVEQLVAKEAERDLISR